MMIKIHYNPDHLDLAGLFAEAQADTRHKTGYFMGTGVEWYTGTFFGMPVKDTKVEGRLWPDYVIHVPEGGIETAGL